MPIHGLVGLAAKSSSKKQVGGDNPEQSEEDEEGDGSKKKRTTKAMKGTQLQIFHDLCITEANNILSLINGCPYRKKVDNKLDKSTYYKDHHGKATTKSDLETRKKNFNQWYHDYHKDVLRLELPTDPVAAAIGGGDEGEILIDLTYSDNQDLQDFAALRKEIVEL